MATKCPSCSKKFNARQALCHDWKDPNRSFGCPHCGTFFVKDMAPNLSESAQTGLVVGGIAVPGMWVTWRGVLTDQLDIAVYGVLIMVSLVVLGLLRSRPWKRELVVSPYKPNREISHD